ncbi:MAG: hypothetical protein JRF40_09460 [Deltaproteobacteria bacterium]|nr:hypothetical protein [Deltaproteobacteria bacterium]
MAEITESKAGTLTKTWPEKAKVFLSKLLPWIISGGLVFYVVLTEDMMAVTEALGKGNFILFLGVVVPFLLFLLFLETVFLFYGFQWFAGVGKLRDLFRARAATYLLTIISIFIGLGGLIVYGKRRYGISYTMGTTIVLNELLHELASQCTLAMMVGLALPLLIVPDAALKQINGVMIAGMIGVGIYAVIILVTMVFRHVLKEYGTIAIFDPFSDISIQQYAVFLIIKLIQNILYGFFLAGLLYAFGIKPPLIVCIAFMQVIHLTRAIPVSAFGIGVDQIAIPFLFSAWEPTGSSGLLLACSLVFTFTLIFGRALLGIPFLKGVFDDLIESSKDEGSN